MTVKRCPFCANDMSSFAGMTPDAFAKGEDTFAINCECGATGPLEPTMQEAVDAWNTRAPAQAVPAPVAWRLTDGEGDYEYLTEEPSDQSRAWSRRYGREWEPLYASPVSSTSRPTPDDDICPYCDADMNDEANCPACGRERVSDGLAMTSTHHSSEAK